MNSFVNYLDQFNVLSPNHSKIYDEYTYEQSENAYSFKIDTKVEHYLIEMFKSRPQSVILTGNAGDGKTRLCRSIYNKFSQQELGNWPTSGIIDIEFIHGKIRIVKDLSELKEEIILQELISLQKGIESNHSKKVYYLIAANEGKLTKFLSQCRDLSSLKKAVTDRFRDYRSNDETFSVINLLSVTSSIYVEKVLAEWNKEENWLPCDGCTSKNSCIIYLNHKRTSQPHVKDRLVEQYRLLDYLGTHITMRELLIHISFLLTGGFTCKDIKDAGYDGLKQQIEKPYYQNFYGHNIEHEAFSEMRALRHFRELDPGAHSVSRIDDFIINGDLSGDKELESLHSALYNNDLDLYLGYFKKRLEMYRDHNKDSNDTLIDEWISKLRRKFYFEFPNEVLFNRKSMIPFQYINEYDQMFDNLIKRMHSRKDIINGLNRSFSKRLVSPSQQLYATNENLMIHSLVPSTQVIIEEENTRNDIDHLPSRFYMAVNHKIKMPVDLHVFEYLMRLNNGNTHNILKEDVEILLDTFKNEIIKNSEQDQFVLNILRLDSEKGLFIHDEIFVD
ncbi:hypothetical protein QNH39_12380 [Neobacillus novalis]|uniref:Uncharacterized protein n=1 Tax=Neobacillus novalis TaxID=220687 RepID=A0AA95MQS8_9BACI|nr:hypothetical protein [Neobacillus novalis]WHY88582.1 hypothetical protein QNH39_12380 [Neobacillus novalis]